MRVFVNRGIVSLSTSWTPLDLGADLVAWYKADVGGISDPITTVPDQSGNGYTLTATNGTVNLNATGINGFPAFQFTQANNAALLSAVNGFTINSSVYTFYLVVAMHFNSNGTGRALAFAANLGADTDAGGIVACQREAGAPSFQICANKNTTNFGVTTDYDMDGAHPRRYGVIASASTLTAYIDGTSVGTTFANPPNTLSSDGTLTVGNLGNPFGNPIEGYIGEIVVTKADNTADLSNLDNYFKDRFGLS